MTTPAVKTLLDEQLEHIERSYPRIIGPGQSLCEALGLPPETRLIDTPIRSVMTIKGGRRWLEVRV